MEFGHCISQDVGLERVFIERNFVKIGTTKFCKNWNHVYLLERFLWQKLFQKISTEVELLLKQTFNFFKSISGRQGMYERCRDF